MGYISKECQQNIKRYKYKGGTASISYDYIWSPLAQACLKFIPLWVAPNLITLTTLLMLTTVHIIFVFYDDNSQNLPSWKCYMMGISILIYQNLDNIDGKQARKTNTSSPLGMLFDHGFDSIASIFLGYQMLIILCVKDPNVLVLILFGFIGIPYFCAMWTQYCTGVFRLGRINAVDQGLPCYAIVCFLAPFLNLNKLLTQFHWFDQVNHQILYGLSILLVFQLISINKNVHKDNTKDKSEAILIILLPILTGLSLIFLIIFCPKDIYSKIYIYMIYIFMFMWTRNMILIQLCSVTKQKFNVFNKGTSFFLLSIFVFIAASKIMDFNSQKYFAVVLIIQFYLLIEFVLSSFKEIAQILDIKIFRIPYLKNEKIIKPQ